MEDRRRVLEHFENNKDFLENTVEKNIEKYRKGDFSIRITDEKGNPLNMANVKITQLSHEFRFGANLFMLDELETDEKNRLYKEYFKDAFNMATLPFYWFTCEPQKGQKRYEKNSPKWYRRPPIDLCIEFCQENGIEPREHALAYERTFPDWLENSTVSQVKEELEKRFSEMAKMYKDKIRTIEVTNEMNWPYGSGKTKFYNEKDYVEWCFKTAEKHFPDNQLVINEATEESWGDNCRATDKYYSYIEANMLKGARIDAIGTQFHMFYKKEDEYEKSKYLYNPLCLYDHMNLYSSLVNCLQVTEITIPAYSNDPLDEEIQSKLLEYLYTLWFSHPSCEQIIYWNLVDGYAYVPSPTPEEIRRTQGNMSIGENYYYGGLLRFDLTPKPAYLTLRHLIKEKWHTECQKSTNCQGRVDFRGFYGDYSIEITANGKTTSKTVSIKKNSERDLTFII